MRKKKRNKEEEFKRQYENYGQTISKGTHKRLQENINNISLCISPNLFVNKNVWKYVCTNETSLKIFVKLHQVYKYTRTGV